MNTKSHSNASRALPAAVEGDRMMNSPVREPAAPPRGATPRRRVLFNWSVATVLFLCLQFFSTSAAQAAEWAWPGNWVNPLTNTVRYQDHGFNTCGYVNNWAHLGADSQLGSGPVRSIGGGKVVAIVGYNVGSAVVVQHASTAGQFVAVYGHINPSTSTGATLTPGQIIGSVADWGGNTHLHFSVIPGAYSSGMNVWGYRDCNTTSTNPGYVNPIPWLSANGPVTVADPNPFGAFDSVQAVQPGTVRVRGWAADPNQKAGSLSVHVYANGQYAGALTANKSRPDVPAVFPGYGSSLGYDNWINMPVSGNVRVCAYAINAGPGWSNTELGCRNVAVVDPNPFGAFDSVQAVQPRTVRVRGWAADPNQKAGPLSVHVYANGQYAGALTANKSRPDVPAVFPGYGSSLGYDNWISIPVSGNVRVCTYAINAGPGWSNTELGCRNLYVP